MAGRPTAAERAIAKKINGLDIETRFAGMSDDAAVAKQREVNANAKAYAKTKAANDAKKAAALAAGGEAPKTRKPRGTSASKIAAEGALPIPPEAQAIMERQTTELLGLETQRTEMLERHEVELVEVRQLIALIQMAEKLPNSDALAAPARERLSQIS